MWRSSGLLSILRPRGDSIHFSNSLGDERIYGKAVSDLDFVQIGYKSCHGHCLHLLWRNSSHLLLELLRKALDCSDMVDGSESQEDRHAAENMPSGFALWKPVLLNLNKQRQLIWSLLKAFFKDLNTKAMKKQTGTI
ncbi:OLC1v1005399C1 [Oldenlandia corymbosa var. corymbosa]|uniref:OLC1v1005399C1 n=1 Tax=Oldenlandia corymbosa var. corymbosa TaxID=529605 RepID=A0AAV1DF82_OLDCO|nr:OLC1v1005399C1 [Oldenlandia corymbosa var. corymbosa]